MPHNCVDTNVNAHVYVVEVDVHSAKSSETEEGAAHIPHRTANHHNSEDWRTSCNRILGVAADDDTGNGARGEYYW